MLTRVLHRVLHTVRHIVSKIVRFLIRVPFVGPRLLLPLLQKLKGLRLDVWNPDVRRLNKMAMARLSRRLRYGSIPSEAARSALIVGQLFQMLNVAEDLLKFYRDRMFPGDRLPPLDLIQQVRRQLFETKLTALDYVRLATREGPNYAEAWCELGRLLFEQERLSDALDAFGMVPISSSFDDPERQPEAIYSVVRNAGVRALYYIGQIHERTGRPDEAVSSYRMALTIDPGCPIVCRSIAEIEFRRGNVAESLPYWNSAMAYRPLVPALPLDGRDLLAFPAVIERHLLRLGRASGAAVT